MSWQPYTVDYSPRAERDLERLDRKVADRIDRAIATFAATGEGDVKRLQGVDRQWRLRVGDWRVVFTFEDAIHVLLVLRVLPRGGAYR